VLVYMFRRVSLHLCAVMLLLLAISCGCMVMSLFVSYLLCAHIEVFPTGVSSCSCCSSLHQSRASGAGLRMVEDGSWEGQGFGMGREEAWCGDGQVGVVQGC